MAAPTTYPSLERFLGVAKDVTPGTPVAPVAYLPFTKFDWNDKITFLDDKAVRGVMADDAFNVIGGVRLGELTFEGPGFFDELGYLLGNIFGADDVTGTAAPFSHKFSLLNSAGGQGTTHTFSQFYGPTPTSGTRQFSGTALSELGFQFNAESELFKYTAKGMSWASQTAGSKPTSSFTAAKPQPSWAVQLGLGGTVGGAPVLTVASGEFNIKRAVKPYYTAQNLRDPYIMQRGGLTADFKLSFVAADETPLTYMLNNTQPQVQLLISNGLSGANLLSLQVDMQQAAFTAAPPNFGSEAIMFDITGKGVLNTTNIGASGGYGPMTVTLQNAIASGTFI
jgi:hypothetical protein